MDVKQLVKTFLKSLLLQSIQEYSLVTDMASLGKNREEEEEA